jgi:hypothetical protein
MFDDRSSSIFLAVKTLDTIAETQTFKLLP